MKAYLSTESPVKHAAVAGAFARLNRDVETVAMPMKSDVSEQPMSIDETYEGAMNRHTKLVEKLGKAAGDDFMITIESGLWIPRAEHNYFGNTVLVVERGGEKRVGIDSDIEFPRELTDRVPRDYPDMGTLVMTEYGAATKDPYPYISGGKITRSKITEDALYNVLVQFDTIT